MSLPLPSQGLSYPECWGDQGGQMEELRHFELGEWRGLYRQEALVLGD